MPLQIKRALGMPFNDQQSVVALAIGSLLSLPGAYAETFRTSLNWTKDLPVDGAHLKLLLPAAPAWVIGLYVLASFVSVGYVVRTMRAEFANSANGAQASLPSWGGNPVDLIVSFFANLLGGILLALGAVAVVIFGCCLAVAIGWFAGVFSGSSVLDPGRTMLALGIVGALVTSPMALFICMSMPMMQAHYARTDRFGAICQWGKIWSVTFRKFWLLLGICVLGGLALSIVEAMASVWFPLAAVVSFYGAVVFANLFAQVYLSQTKVTA